MFSDTLANTLSRRTFLRTLAGFWLAACTAVSTGAQAAPTILVLGDSLSAEYGLQRGKGWVTLLEQRLKDKQLDYSVVNASISGDTSSGGAARLPGALAQSKPAVVIIELGANDGLRGLSLAATKANFDTMISASQKAGAKVLLVGMQMPPNFGRDFTEKFRSMYGELAQKHKTALAPFLLDGFADKPEMFQGDGIHPLAQAHPRMLDNVWPALEPLLRPSAKPKR
jgi:acyl-CoA thioesterase-1